MFNNLYDKIKKFIKEYYKNILFIVVLYVVFMWPVNYYIITGGGIMEVGNRINVSDSYKSKGSLNLAYVSEAKGTIATYALSYVMPNWERVKASDYAYDEEETVADINFRGDIDLLNANCYAIKNAYKEANKHYEVTSTKLYVYFIDKTSKNNFKVGDQILEFDGNRIFNVNDYKNVLSSHSAGDKVKIIVKRNGKKKNVSATLYEKEGQILSGIYINSIDSYKTDPNVEIKFKKSESGPSGGLIETLDIYNKLTKKDITRGRKIAGTGEIDSDGNILTIGGVKYKLRGAEKAKADVFLVPNGSNYKECIKIKEKEKLKIKVIGVSTFKDAVMKLKK